MIQPVTFEELNPTVIRLLDGANIPFDEGLTETLSRIS